MVNMVSLPAMMPSVSGNPIRSIITATLLALSYVVCVAVMVLVDFLWNFLRRNALIRSLKPYFCGILIHKNFLYIDYFSFCKVFWRLFFICHRSCLPIYPISIWKISKNVCKYKDKRFGFKIKVLAEGLGNLIEKRELRCFFMAIAYIKECLKTQWFWHVFLWVNTRGG